MASKKIDLRETGPQNYRQLQEANSAEYQSAIQDPEFEKILNWGYSTPSSSAFNPQSEEEQYVQSNTGDFGQSMFDPNTTSAEGVNRVGDLRAYNQPWYAQLGAGVGKMVTTAGTTFVDGTVGLLYGLGTAGARWKRGEGTAHVLAGIFDNDVTRTMAEISESMEQILPNYQSEVEQNTVWYKRMNTMNFWSDNIIKNLGFMIGAYYSGGAYTGVLKAMGALKNGITAQIVGTTLNAITEGSIEGLNASRDMVNYESNLINDHIKSKQDELLSSGMSYEDIAAGLSNLEEERNRLLADLNHRADKTGIVTMGLNIPLLAAQEWFTFGKLYARGFKNSNELASQTIRNATGQTLREGAGALERGAAMEAAEEATERVVRNGTQYAWEEIGFGGGLKRGLRTMLLEGNEEMSQGFASEYAANLYSPDDPDAYYKSIIDNYGTLATQDYWNSAIKALSETYGNVDRWEEFAAGAISSMLGIPTFGRIQNSDANTWLGRGRTVGLSGGLIGEITNALAQDKEGKANVAKMNAVVSKLQNNARYFAQSSSFTDAMDGYSEEGDEFRYKNMRENEAFSGVSAFARAGRLGELRDMVNQSFENISDEELDKIAKYTTPNLELDEDGNVIKTDENGNPLKGGWRAADGSLMSETEEGKAQMRKELAKKRNTILAEIDRYVEAVEEVRAISNHALTEDAVEELAWLSWKGKAFDERYKSIREKNSAIFKKLSDALLSWRDTLDRQGNLTEEQEKNKKLINSLLDYVSFMQKSQSALDMGARVRGNKELVQSLSEILNYTQLRDGKEGKLYSMLEHLQNHGFDLSYGDLQQFQKDLIDMGKLASSAYNFNERYKEFLQDPLKIREHWRKLDAEKAQRERKQKKENNQRTLANAKVQDVRQAVDNGIISDEELNEILNDDATPAETKEAIETYKEINEEADAIIKELEELRNKQNSQQIDNALALLAVGREQAESVDDLRDLSKQNYNDPNNLDNSDLQDLPTPEEIAEAVNSRMGVVKTLLREAIDKKDEKKKKAEGLPNTPTTESNEEQGGTGHDETPTVTSENEKEEQREEQKKESNNNEENNKENSEENNDNSPQPQPQIQPQTQLQTTQEQSLESQLDDLDKNAKEEYQRGINSGSQTPLEFWKPTTTRLPIHMNKGDRTPFYQLAKNMKKPDGSPRYSDSQLQRMEAIYKFLDEHHAYDIIENGEIKVGDKVQFKIYSDLNDKAGGFVIVICDSQGRPIGDIMSAEEALAQRQVGLVQFINDVMAAYKNAGSPEEFTYEHTSTVSSNMVGRVPYTADARTQSITLNDLFKNNPNDLVIGVNVYGGVETKGVIRTQSGSSSTKNEKELAIIPPLHINLGKPVVVLKTGDSNRQIAVPFAMPVYNREQHSNSKLGKAIEDTVKNIITSNDRSAIDVIKKLKSLLNLANVNIHYRSNNRVIVIIQKQGGVKETVYEGDLNGVVEPVLSALNGIPFRVDRAFINKDFEAGQKYNEMVGELAVVNLDTTHTINDWFTINPIDPQGKEQKSRPPKSLGVNPNPTVKTINVEKGGHTIAVDFDNRTATVIDTGKVYQLYNSKDGTLYNNVAKIFAYAYGLRTRQDMSKPYDTEWGTYDPVNDKFVEKKAEEPVDPITGLTASEMAEVNEELDELQSIASEVEDVTTDEINETIEQDKQKKSDEKKRTAEDYQSFHDLRNMYTGEKAAVNWNAKGRGAYVQINLLHKDRYDRDITQEEMQLFADATSGKFHDYIQRALDYMKDNHLGEPQVEQNPSQEKQQERKEKAINRINKLVKSVYTVIHEIADKHGSVPTYESYARVIYVFEHHLSEFSQEEIIEIINKIGVLETSFYTFEKEYGEDYNYNRGDNEESTNQYMVLREIKKIFEQNGYEIVNMLGKPYNDGMKVIANFTVDDTLPRGTKIITRIRKPQINYKGKMIQSADIQVTQSPYDDETEIIIPSIGRPIWSEITTVEAATSKVMAKGLLKTELRKQIWDSLTDEQKINLSTNPRIRSIMLTLEKNYNKDEGKFNTNALCQSILDILSGAPKNRVVDNKNRKVFSRQKEVSWLRKVLPNMTTDGRLKVVKGLIKVNNDANPVYAYGQFQKGVITLSDKAAEGTVYHEAFHAVVELLLNSKEITDLMAAARQQYGNKSSLELEELLAEDFRRYVQTEQRPIIGFIVRAFRQLKHIIQNLIGNELYINNLFYRINNGEYANQDFLSEREQQESDRTDIAKDTAKIRQYHRDKLSFGRLSQDTQEYIKNKFGIEEYNNMPDLMKEVALRCRH